MTVSTGAGFGRLMIFLAVLCQAVGKVTFGTWLAALPAALFVLVSFGLTAAFFLCASRRGVGRPAWGPLLLLNASTALTFLCFFQALKLIEPAIVGAVEIGIGPVAALLLAWALAGRPPRARQWLVCAGVLAGCAVLALAAMQDASPTNAWLGLAASAAAGLGAVLVTTASRELIGRGWSFGAVLAHRFYLILPVSLLLSLGADLPGIEWNGGLLAALLAVSVVGVLAPLYLLQVGIGRCDTYTVMVTMSALPVLTFLIEGLSPAYRWSWPTALGLAVVTAFLLLDIMARTPAPTSPEQGEEQPARRPL